MPKQYKESPNTLHLVSTHVNTIQINGTVIQTRKLALATNLIQISSSSPSGPEPIQDHRSTCFLSLSSWDSTFTYSAMAFVLLSASQQFCRVCLHGSWSAVSSGCAFFFQIYLFFIFGCAGSFCCTGFSLVVASGVHSLVAMCGLLIAVASLVCPRAHRLQEWQHSGSAVVAHGLSCCEPRGIFPDQGSNPYLLH